MSLEELKESSEEEFLAASASSSSSHASSQRMTANGRRHDSPLSDDEVDGAINTDDYRSRRSAGSSASSSRSFPSSFHVYHHFYDESKESESEEEMSADEEESRLPGPTAPVGAAVAAWLLDRVPAHLASSERALLYWLRFTPHPMVLLTGARVLASLSAPVAAMAATSIQVTTVGTAAGTLVAACRHTAQRQRVLEVRNRQQQLARSADPSSAASALLIRVLTSCICVLSAVCVFQWIELIFDRYLRDRFWVDHDLSAEVCEMLDKLRAIPQCKVRRREVLWQRARDRAESQYICEDGSRWDPNPDSAMRRGALVGFSLSAMASGLLAFVRARSTAAEDQQKSQRQTAKAGQCSLQ